MIADAPGGAAPGPGTATGVTLRAARPGDLSAVLALWRRSAEPSRTDDVESLRRLLARDEDALIVAEADGAVVGSVIAAWDGWRGSVYRLAVAPSHRRRGLARRLLATAESHLVRRGAARFQAVVIGTETAATGFWRDTDWEEQVERIRFTKG